MDEEVDEGMGTELDLIRETLAADESRRAALAEGAPRGFRPEALFLLGLGYENLFDPTARSDEFACRGCGAIVKAWKRSAHHAAHRRSAQSTAGTSGTYSKGGSTSMAAAEKTRVSGRQACIAAIRAGDRPMSANEIATLVVESGIVEGLKGKTPKATLSAQITSAAKKGELFKKVGQGRPARFALRADAPESDEKVVKKLRDRLAKTEAATTEPEAEVEVPTAAADGDTASGDGTQVEPDPKPTASTRRRSRSKKAGATA